MNKEYRYTKEDVIGEGREMVYEYEEEAPEKGAVKPNVMSMLLNEAKLKGQGEHGTEPTI